MTYSGYFTIQCWVVRGNISVMTTRLNLYGFPRYSSEWERLYCAFQSSLISSQVLFWFIFLYTAKISHFAVSKQYSGTVLCQQQWIPSQLLRVQAETQRLQGKGNPHLPEWVTVSVATIHRNSALVSLYLSICKGAAEQILINKTVVNESEQQLQLPV